MMNNINKIICVKKITEKFALSAQMRFAVTSHRCPPARTRWQPYPSKLETRNFFSKGYSKSGKKVGNCREKQPLLRKISNYIIKIYEYKINCEISG